MSSLAVGNWTEENVFVTAYVASACVLCVTGLVGNAALLVILLVSKRSSSMNCLLVALTIIDTVYLSASLAVVFLYDMDYLYDLPIRYSLSGVMSAWIILYVIRWSQLAGIWITVQISFERWLAVTKPLNGAFSVRKTKRLSVTLIVASILYELPGFLFANPSCTSELEQQKEQNESTENNSEAPCELIRASWASDEFTVYYTSVSYALLSFAVPLVCVVTFSLLTLRTIRQVRKDSLRLHSLRSFNAQTQHTVMVLLLSAMFLMFEVPSLICRAIQSFSLTDLRHFTADDLYVLAAICAILYATVNFVLYCLCSRRFRKLLRSALCACNGLKRSGSFSYVRRYPTIVSTDHDRANSCVL